MTNSNSAPEKSNHLIPLLYLQTKAQFEFLCEYHPEILKTSRIIACNLDVSALLSMAEIPHQTSWEIVGAERLQELWQEGIDLQKHWNQVVEIWEKEAFEVPFPFASTTYYGWNYFFQECLVSAEIFFASLSVKPEKLLLFPSRFQPLVCEPTGDEAVGIWKYLAENSVPPIPCETFDMSYGNKGRQQSILTRVLHSKARDTVREIVKPTVNIIEPDQAGDQPSCNAAIFQFGDLDRYVGVLKSLTNSTRMPLKLLTTGYARKTEKYRFLNVEEMLSIEKKWKRGEKKVAFPLHILSDRLPYIFDNPHMSYQFEYFIGDLFPRMSLVAKFLPVWFKENEIKNALIPDISYEHIDLVVNAAKFAGVATISVPHSGMPGTDNRHVIADTSVVWSEDYCESLVQWGANRENVKVVGFSESVILRSYQQKPIVETVEKPDNQKVVLILSVTTTVGMCAPLNIQKYAQTVEQLTNVPQSVAGKIRVLWKTHPGHDHLDYIAFCMKGRTNIELTQNSSLFQCVEKADLVVVTLPTSAFWASLLAGVPTLYLDTCDFNRPGFFMHQHIGPTTHVGIESLWEKINAYLFDVTGIEMLKEDNKKLLDKFNPSGKTISDYDLGQILADIMNGGA